MLILSENNMQRCVAGSPFPALQYTNGKMGE